MKTIAATFILIGLISFLLLPSSKLVEAQEKKAEPKAKDKEKPIDYEALLNEKLGKGVTPEKNAVVLLWKALGPTPEGGDGMPPEFFKRLGIEEPAKRGDYYVSLNSYMKNQPKLDPDKFSEIWDQQGKASKHPWEDKDYPHVAAWLKLNEKPLALAIEASDRPEYYNPLVSRSGNSPGSIIGSLLPAVQKCRELACAFTARAMLNTFSGKHDLAWRDLLACHRLGRQIARGGTLIEELVGIAIDQYAFNADLAFLQHAGLTSAKIMSCMKELQSLAPMPSIADKIDLTERMTCLQLFQGFRNNPGKSFGILDDLTEEERKGMENIDWDQAIKNANTWYDRVITTIRIMDRSNREKEFDKIEKELQTLAKERKEQKNLKTILANPKDGKSVATAISNVLIGLLMPAFRKVTGAQDRSLQNEGNLRVAFALEAYKRDEGKYPAKLTDLSPKYLTTIPDDLFSGKPLIYKPSEKDYLLYSVGPNGKDDEGRGMEDDPRGDDLRVRMPLPPLQPIKQLKQ